MSLRGASKTHRAPPPSRFPGWLTALSGLTGSSCLSEQAPAVRQDADPPPQHRPRATGPSSPALHPERIRAPTRAQGKRVILPETSASRFYTLSQTASRRRHSPAPPPPGGARPAPRKCGEPGDTETRCGGQGWEGGRQERRLPFRGHPEPRPLTSASQVVTASQNFGPEARPGRARSRDDQSGLGAGGLRRDRPREAR